MGKHRGQIGTAARLLEVLWTSGTLTGLSDDQLLGRFTEARDATAEAAFRELLHRHGPMVLGVCRQVVREPHGADDAFQATFLVLVRKARTVRVRGSLAPWLYGVAIRTARRARSIASRHQAADAEQIEAAEAPSQEGDAYQIDLRPLLLEELDRLPGKYREPIVLCHLEGKTHEEAARLLEWPVGTVSGRLSRGRQLLKSRLERRGLAVPSAIPAAPGLVGIQAAVSLPLTESAITAATRFAAALPVSSSVLSLTLGVLRTMLIHRLKKVALALLLFGTLTGGVGVWAHWPSHATANAVRGSERTLNPTASPIPKASPAAQPATSNAQLVADDCPVDDCPNDCPCPVFGSGNRSESCPLTMAANSISRVISYFHEGPAVSR